VNVSVNLQSVESINPFNRCDTDKKDSGSSLLAAGKSGMTVHVCCDTENSPSEIIQVPTNMLSAQR